MKLQDLTEAFGDLPDLIESLKGDGRVVKWHNRKDGESGIEAIETINDSVYRIIIEPAKIKVTSIQYSIINVAFEKEDKDGNFTQSITNDSKNSMLVIGVIVDALDKEVSKYDYDAVVFIANDTADKRMSMYNRVARRVTNNMHGTRLQDLAFGHGKKMTVILKDFLKDDEKKKLTGKLVDELKKINT